MATSACPKCGNTSFESKDHTPQTSNFIVTFIQCAACGTVVGVMDYYNIGGLLQTLAKKLGVGSIA